MHKFQTLKGKYLLLVQGRRQGGACPSPPIDMLGPNQQASSFEDSGFWA